MYSHHQDKPPAFLDNLFKSNKVYIHTIRDQQRTCILNLEKQIMANILYVLTEQLYGMTFPQKKKHKFV